MIEGFSVVVGRRPEAVEPIRRVLRGTGCEARFLKDALIYAEGDAALNGFVVVDGVVRTARYSEFGVRQVTGFYFPGDVFGLENCCYRSSAEAVTDVVLERWGRGGSEGGPLAKSDLVASALLKAFEAAEERVKIVGTRGAAHRLAAFLLALPREGLNGERVRLRMPRSDIADFIAIDAATLSRTFARLIRSGWLAFSGPQICEIKDRDALINLMNGREGRLPEQPDFRRSASDAAVAGRAESLSGGLNRRP